MKKSLLKKILSIGIGFSSLFGGYQIKALENTESQTIQNLEVDQIVNEINDSYNANAQQLLDCWTKLARLNTQKEDEISPKSRGLALALSVVDFFSLGTFSFSYLYQGKIKKASPLPPVFGWYRSLYNFTHLLPGTQTDCDGKLIKNW